MTTPKVHRPSGATGGDELIVEKGGRITQTQAAAIYPNLTVATITTAGAATYTAAQIAGGVIKRDPAGAARTDTTETAANLIAATGLDLKADGEAFACYLINTADAAEAITLAGGTGVTIVNAGNTLAQNESAILLFVRTSATAVDCYIIGA